VSQAEKHGTGTALFASARPRAPPLMLARRAEIKDDVLSREGNVLGLRPWVPGLNSSSDKNFIFRNTAIGFRSPD